MGLVVDSPVRVCHTWLKKPLGPVQKGAISMRRRLDTYGYAPESIEYCDQETIIAASDSGTLKVEYSRFGEAIEWLNPMSSAALGDDGFPQLVVALTGCKTDYRALTSVLEGSLFCDITEVQDQKTAVETAMSLALNLEHVKAVGCAKAKARAAGNMSSCRRGTVLEDAKPGAPVGFSHGAVSISGNHAVRLENNRLHVLASRLPRMQPPAGASHVVFKSLKHGVACLLLPEDAWTNSDGSRSGGKFRAEKLYVVAVWNLSTDSPAESDVSGHDSSFVYRAGEIAATAVDKNPGVLYGAGLHFFLSLEEANMYNGGRIDADKLQQVRDYFERRLTQIPADWNTARALAAGAAVDSGSVLPAPQTGTLEILEENKPPADFKEDTDEKRTYSRYVEPTAYLAERPDREQEVRRAQLQSFRVRLRYSENMFRAHYDAVREMLDEDESAAACALLDRISSVRDDRVEGIEEASSVFKDADEFRANTTRRYIDPSAMRVTSSIYFRY